MTMTCSNPKLIGRFDYKSCGQSSRRLDSSPTGWLLD